MASKIGSSWVGIIVIIVVAVGLCDCVGICCNDDTEGQLFGGKGCWWEAAGVPVMLRAGWKWWSWEGMFEPTVEFIIWCVCCYSCHCRGCCCRIIWLKLCCYWRQYLCRGSRVLRQKWLLSSSCRVTSNTFSWLKIVEASCRIHTWHVQYVSTIGFLGALAGPSRFCVALFAFFPVPLGMSMLARDVILGLTDPALNTLRNFCSSLLCSATATTLLQRWTLEYRRQCLSHSNKLPPVAFLTYW